MLYNITHCCPRTPQKRPVLLFNSFGVRFFKISFKGNIGEGWPQVLFRLHIHRLFPNNESPKGKAPITVKGTCVREREVSSH